MMVTTHAAAGLCLAIPLTVAAPGLAPVGAAAALAGGAFPDVDLFVGTHRKTLHFPVYYAVAGAVAGAVAVVVPSPVTVAVALFLLSAALHSVTDWFGGSDELRPWERTSDRAVYVHATRRWLRPRHLVRYDGAVEDLALTILLSVPAFLAFGGGLRLVVAAGVVVGLLYTGFRKRMPDWFGI